MEFQTADKPIEQESPKKKEVNWQESVEKAEPAIDSTPAANDETAEAAGIMRQESLQRQDSKAGAGKVEGAGQTGTAKRKKKKKEEVMLSRIYTYKCYSRDVDEQRKRIFLTCLFFYFSRKAKKIKSPKSPPLLLHIQQQVKSNYPCNVVK